jgi:perosamine synthetase
MKIGRTLPPAAAPLEWKDIWHGIVGLVTRERAVRRLEGEIRREFGVAHVFLVSSGTAALTLTLTALKSLSPAREVVLPAFTCFSVPAAILAAGLQPAPCDIDAATFDFDLASFDRALNDRTLCVIAHHLFGVVSDIEQIRAQCRSRPIFIIEDAAQAMGAEVRGGKLGTLGDVGIFSLGRGKNITCGAGGVIISNSDRIAEAIDRSYRPLRATALSGQLKDLVGVSLMTIFIRPSLYWIPAALPFLRLGETIFPKRIAVRRLAGVHAGLLRGWPTRLARANRLRCETAAYFIRRLSRAPALGRPHPYLRLPILVASARERARIHSLSRRRGLGIGRVFPTPVSEIPQVRSACHRQHFPCARRVAETLLTVPTHQWLTDNDKRALADLLTEVDLRLPQWKH